MLHDPLIPEPFRILENKRESQDVFTLALEPIHQRDFSFLPGQYNMVHAFGIGASAISISASSQEKKILHTIRTVGSVTNNLQKLAKNDIVGIRGPFGTPWPMEKLKGKYILLLAGGIGLAPLRSLIKTLLSHPKDYQDITLIYGARSPSDLIYQAELSAWRKALHVLLTVDHADKDWEHDVGVVPQFIPLVVKDPKNTVVLMCGPEVMMRFCLFALREAEITFNNIYLSMERNMQCAIGHCGHCQWGPFFICKDGPIMNFKEIEPFFYKNEL